MNGLMLVARQQTAAHLADMANLSAVERIIAALDDQRTYIEIHGAAVWWDDGEDSGKTGWTVARYDKAERRHTGLLSETKYGTFAEALTAATQPD